MYCGHFTSIVHLQIKAIWYANKTKNCFHACTWHCESHREFVILPHPTSTVLRTALDHSWYKGIKFTLNIPQWPFKSITHQLTEPNCPTKIVCLNSSAIIDEQNRLAASQGTSVGELSSEPWCFGNSDYNHPIMVSPIRKQRLSGETTLPQPQHRSCTTEKAPSLSTYSPHFANIN